MIINNVYLFKCPLDNTYKNVIDVNIPYDWGVIDDARDVIFDVLMHYYNPLVIGELNLRTIKKTQDYSSITIQSNYDLIRDYNYIVLTNNSGVKQFYFINNIVSENEGATSNSVTLTIEWDSWTNNYDRIYHSSSNNSIICSHRDRFLLKGNNIYPRFYEHKDNNIEHYITDINVRGDRYIPVFAKIILKQSLVINDIDDENKFSKMMSGYLGITRRPSYLDATKLPVFIIDSVNKSYKIPILYSLIGAYDLTDNKYVNYYYRGAGYSLLTDDALVDLDTSLMYGATYKEFVVPPEYYEYIQSVELTFVSPFRYVQSFSDDGNVVFEFSQNAIAHTNNLQNVILGSYYYQDGQNSWFSYTNGFSFRDETFVIEERDILGLNIFDDKGLFRVNSNILDAFGASRIEPARFDYPFKYITLSNNNEQITLSRLGQFENNYNVTIITETRQPLMKVSNIQQIPEVLSPVRCYSITNIPLKNSGYFSYGTDALTSFMVRNGNSLMLSRYASLANMIMNNISGGLTSLRFASDGSAISGVANYASSLIKNRYNYIMENLRFRANLADLYSTPDSIHVDTGECDLYYQDRVRCSLHTCADGDFTLKQTLLNYYLYGYDTEVIDDIFINNRYNFDFIQTKNCSLPQLSNINSGDRIKLENIFDRGFTRWHINLDRDTREEYTLDFGMNKDELSIPNIEKKFYYNDDYYNWANG